MLIFIYIKYETSYDRFHGKKKSIFRVTCTIKTSDLADRFSGLTNYYHGSKFKEQIPEINAYVRILSSNAAVKIGNGVEKQEVIYADNSFFSIFDFPLILGSKDNVLLNPDNVVLTRRAALKYFGDLEVLGKIIAIRDNSGIFRPFTVSGVSEDPPSNSSLKFDILLSSKASPDYSENVQWLGFYLTTFLVVSPESAATVEQKINRIFQKEASEELRLIKANEKVDLAVKFLLQPLLDIHLNSDFTENANGLSDISNPIFSIVLTILSLFMLLIGSINFINLTISTYLKRNKEVGVRKALGSTRNQIIGQFLIESGISCFAAFFLALILSCLLLPVINLITQRHIQFESLLDWQFAAGIVFIFLITMAVSCLYPAFVQSAYNPIKVISSRATKFERNIGRFLIIVQFFTTNLMLLGTIIIYLQINFLVSLGIGYDDRNLLTIQTDGDYDLDFFSRFKRGIESFPNVSSVAVRFARNQVKGLVNQREIECESFAVDEDYIPTLKIPLIAGRNFSNDYPSDSSQSAIVNETFLKNSGLQSAALDETIELVWDNSRLKIIGVIKDYHFDSKKKKIAPLVLRMPNRKSYPSTQIYLKVRPTITPAVIDTARNRYQAVFVTSPFIFNFLDEDNAEAYATEMRWKVLSFWFTLLALVVSGIGMFALSVSVTEQKVREISIRKILGSTNFQIVVNLSMEFLILEIISIALAVPVSIILKDEWLKNFSYKVSISWWVFTASSIFILFITLIPVCYQALRTAKRNPVNILR